jgi:hypothetical protein
MKLSTKAGRPGQSSLLQLEITQGVATVKEKRHLKHVREQVTNSPSL